MDTATGNGDIISHPLYCGLNILDCDVFSECACAATCAQHASRMPLARVSHSAQRQPAPITEYVSSCLKAYERGRVEWNVQVHILVPRWDVSNAAGEVGAAKADQTTTQHGAQNHNSEQTKFCDSEWI